MGVYIAKRLAASAVTALLTSIVVFLLVRSVPGDVVGQMLGQTSDPVAAKALREFFGLDQPVWRQYANWLGRVLAGDFGTSWTRGQPVMGMVGSALGVTIQLAAATLVLATAIGVPLGILAAIYEGRAPDRIVQAFNLLGLAAPVFWIGLMLLVGMSSSFDWSPPLMYVPLHESVSENLSIIALPVLSLALLQAAAYSQFVRQSIVSALGQDYVRTAVAKGLSTRTVFFRHLLRNIGIPLVTFMGLILIQILGGAVIIESLFALPGLGRLLLSSIETRDYPVLQAGLLVVVVIAMLVNLVVDLSYRIIDPRVRLS
ncbi:ABC transporter permease [Bosea thiooxidans]|uniref:ABC transporter permease n=1 Tax=Bosea thiooxidans TaxID=53254 RepID=A0A0Q3KVX1_9HYPH|nr:ABC transporter permease [Bosea thiooxidans]KQK28572.1 ABC transporter permease [Bosea thiooxidans]SKC13902.1 peptide/nickel transport system permease protein [Bosea thiooxidans]